jgi:plastocyanin
MRTMSPIALSILAAAALLAVAAAPNRAAPDKAPPDKDVIVVKIQNLTLIPETVTITVGQTVRWTNNDDRDYLLVARDQSFNSGNIRPKEKFEHKFKEAGSYEYGCAIHPRLIGTVVVEEKK